VGSNPTGPAITQNLILWHATLKEGLGRFLPENCC